MNGAPRLTVHELNKDEYHPDTGLEPETSDMPGKRATFTPWTKNHG